MKRELKKNYRTGSKKNLAVSELCATGEGSDIQSMSRHENQHEAKITPRAIAAGQQYVTGIGRVIYGESGRNYGKKKNVENWRWK